MITFDPTTWAMPTTPLYAGSTGQGSIINSLRPVMQQAAAQGAVNALSAAAPPPVYVGSMPRDQGETEMGAAGYTGQRYEDMDPRQAAEELGNVKAAEEVLSPLGVPESGMGKAAKVGTSLATLPLGMSGALFGFLGYGANRMAENDITGYGNALRGTPEGREFEFYASGIPGTEFYQNPNSGSPSEGIPNAIGSYQPLTGDYTMDYAGSNYSGDWGGDYGGGWGSDTGIGASASSGFSDQW